MIFDGMLRNLDNVSGKIPNVSKKGESRILRRSTVLDKEDTSKQERIDEIDVDENIALVSTHNDNIVQDEGIKDVGEEEVVEASKRKGVMIQEPEETITTKTASSQQPQVQDKGKAKLIKEPKMPKKKKHQIRVDKELVVKLQAEIDEEERIAREKAQQVEETRALKNKSFAEIQELFDKAMKRINNFFDFRTELVEENTKKDEAEIAKESSSNREGGELERERSKKRKVQDDKESEELKKYLEIIPYDGDDVKIDATPLSVKTTIIDYQIYKEGKKSYFQIFRALGIHRLDHMDSFLTHHLKTMFKHYVEDNVWKNQQGLAKSIPSKDPYEEVAQHLLEQAPRFPEYVPDPIELEDHVPSHIPEHPEDLVPAEDEAPIEAYIPEMRAAVPSTYHSLLPSRTPPLLLIPLPVPSISRRAEIPEADTPPWKRLPRPRCKVGESSAATAARQPRPTMDRSVDCSFIDTMETRFRDTERRMMTALEMVNKRVSYQVEVHSRENLEFYSRHHDAQKDRAAVRAEIEVLRRERLAYEQESIQTREALARSKAYSKALKARVVVLETQAGRHEWQRQTADDLVVQHIMRTQALEAGACIDTLEDIGNSS
nr:hypothetical protein [Tanacetum cinerariifolium]